MDRFERILLLHRKLAGNRYGTSFAALHESLDWSRSTLRRALDDLRDKLGAPLINDRERGGYYYDTSVRFELPGLWFSAEELSALLLIENVLERQPHGLLSETLRPFRERLEALAQKSGVGIPEWRTRLRLLRMAVRPAGSQFPIVAEAVAQRRRLRIDYHARYNDHMPPPRTISPQRLALYRDNWYLDAWCHEREDIRIFALDRIIAAEILDQPAQEIPPEQLKEVLTTSYGIFAGRPKATATLRFSAHAARWVSDETWHPRQQDERAEDGTLIRRIPYHRSEELLMDILRHGAEVEVLEPPSLRDAVVERLRSALERYQATTNTHAVAHISAA